MQTTDFRGYDLGAIIAEQPDLICVRDAEGNTIVTVGGASFNCHPLRTDYYDENNNIVKTPPCYPIRFDISPDGLDRPFTVYQCGGVWYPAAVVGGTAYMPYLNSVKCDGSCNGVDGNCAV